MFSWLFRREPEPTPHAETATDVVALARVEAAARDQEYVGTQHLLLALARLVDRPAGRVLAGAGVTPDRLRKALSEHLQRGLGEVPAADLPLSPTAQRAVSWAQKDGGSEPEVLLLVLLTDPDGVALDAVTGMGIDVAQVRRRLSPPSS